MKYTANSTLAEILQHPRGVEILAKFGVPCPTCPLFAAEVAKLTIGQVTKMYGLDLKKILAELNKQ